MRIFSTGWSNGFDGPGRRWVVYLKGCNFRCKWCANPESLLVDPQILFYPERGANPQTACPYGAVSKERPWKLDRTICRTCSDRPCINKWHNRCFELAGRDITPKKILTEVRRIKGLFGKSGGITFGGGEALLQLDELLETAALLQGECHRAVETNASSENFEHVLDAFDLLITDLKCVSDSTALKWIGAKAGRSVNNILTAASSGIDMTIRVPLVKGFNDGPKELGLIKEVLKDAKARNGNINIEVLRMHHIGRPKYKALDMVYNMKDTAEPSEKETLKFIDMLKQENINAQLVS
ncbi:MAG: glycyl-radical enzyme activating protein [Sedimentisphaeraceae bacterium JB056]